MYRILPLYSSTITCPPHPRCFAHRNCPLYLSVSDPLGKDSLSHRLPRRLLCRLFLILTKSNWYLPSDSNNARSASLSGGLRQDCSKFLRKRSLSLVQTSMLIFQPHPLTHTISPFKNRINRSIPRGLFYRYRSALFYPMPRTSHSERKMATMCRVVDSLNPSKFVWLDFRIIRRYVRKPRDTLRDG